MAFPGCTKPRRSCSPPRLRNSFRREEPSGGFDFHNCFQFNHFRMARPRKHRFELTGFSLKSNSLSIGAEAPGVEPGRLCPPLWPGQTCRRLRRQGGRESRGRPKAPPACSELHAARRHFDASGQAQAYSGDRRKAGFGLRSLLPVKSSKIALADAQCAFRVKVL